jgi:hypothetical protein
MAQERARACPEFPLPRQEVFKEDEVQDPMVGGVQCVFQLRFSSYVLS